MNIIVSNPDRALLEEFEYLKIAAQDTEVTEVDCIFFFLVKELTRSPGDGNDILGPGRRTCGPQHICSSVLQSAVFHD